MQWGGRVVTIINTQKINKNKALWGWWWGGVVVGFDSDLTKNTKIFV